jgi:putative transposase
MMSEARKRYPSDLTDAQWSLIEMLLPPAKCGGRPRSTDIREVMNAILYQVRSGCQWDMLPHDFPCKSTVYEYFSQYRDDGTWERINAVLVGSVRQLHAKSESIAPSAASIDSQTVKASEHCDSRGYDGGKKITGRKRNIAVDTLGLLLAVVVTVASVDDAYAARQVFEHLKPHTQPCLKTVWADSKYHNYDLYAWIKRQTSITWELEIVRRPPGVSGFVLLPKRWVVERTFSWLNRWRRLSRDYEHRTDSSEAMVRIASIGRMLRFLEPDKSVPPFNYK